MGWPIKPQRNIKLKGKNKYGAKRTNGFPSKLESDVWDLLLEREKAGEIEDVKQQQTVVLQDGAPDQRIAWKIDFSFVEVASGKRVYAEAKGFEDMNYLIKLKLYRANPPAPLEIYKSGHAGPKCVERIEPKTE